MIALLLAALLAQTAPASAAPEATPQPSVPAIGNDSPIIRRMPNELPKTMPGDAVIRNSGSTNTSGYEIVVHPDFTADVYEGGTSHRASVAAAQAKWLFAKLKADEPFSSLSAVHCMKSSSFGTTTSIVYDGATTPDLSCGAGDEGRELERTIAVIVNQLGVKPMTGGFRRRLL